MRKLLVPLACLSVFLLIAIGGCSSKKEEVAIAPTQSVPAAQQADYDSSANDSSMNDGSDGSDDGSDATDDDSANDTGDDGSDATDDDASMAEEDSSGDDASMADDDGTGLAVLAKPKNLREQAEQAFGDGQEKAAYRLIQAHALSSSTDASEILSNYRWSPSRRQPQLGARIAVGVFLTAPSELKDYKPIGSLRGFFSNRKTTSRNRANPASDEVQEDGGEISPTLFASNNQERILQKYTGLMGDVLVDHFKSTHREGKWAPIFQSLAGVASAPMSVSNGDGSDDGSVDSDDSGDMLTATSLKSELTTKIEGDEAKYISVGPALTFIGTGSSAELLDIAKAGEFDALIVFDVEITLNLKLRMIYNECRAKLINFTDGKSLATSKLLKNTEAQKEIDKSGRSFVETAMQPVLAKLDELVAMKEIPPALTPEIIKAKRLASLVSDAARPKLDSLAEIRLYREKLLLDDEDVKAAFGSILGAEDGVALATGTDEERLEVVKKLLVNSN